MPIFKLFKSDPTFIKVETKIVVITDGHEKTFILLHELFGANLKTSKLGTTHRLRNLILKEKKKISCVSLPFIYM